jgi:hypothetical protein
MVICKLTDFTSKKVRGLKFILQHLLYPHEWFIVINEESVIYSCKFSQVEESRTWRRFSHK